MTIIPLGFMDLEDEEDNSPRIIRKSRPTTAQLEPTPPKSRPGTASARPVRKSSRDIWSAKSREAPKSKIPRPTTAPPLSTHARPGATRHGGKISFSKGFSVNDLGIVGFELEEFVLAEKLAMNRHFSPIDISRLLDNPPSAMPMYEFSRSEKAQSVISIHDVRHLKIMAQQPPNSSRPRKLMNYSERYMQRYRTQHTPHHIAAAEKMKSAENDILQEISKLDSLLTIRLNVLRQYHSIIVHEDNYSSVKNN